MHPKPLSRLEGFGIARPLQKAINADPPVENARAITTRRAIAGPAWHELQPLTLTLPSQKPPVQDHTCWAQQVRSFSSRIDKDGVC